MLRFGDMINAVTGGGANSGFIQQPGASGDFSGQLNNILAPYQKMAAPFMSPYATISPNSWLARRAPKVAGVLDNAFLSGAMTPGPQGPEGAGEGVSRAFQGLMGAQQYRRQMMLQGMMLPYEMAGRQLQMMDVASQIKEREAMAPYYRSRADWYEARMGQMNQPHAMAGQPQIDDQNRSWDRIFDPNTGKIRQWNADLQKFSDELPADQQPKFEKWNQRNKMFGEGGGGFLGQLSVAQAGPKLDKESPEDYAKRVGNIYTRLGGQMAGLRTQGEQDAPHPYTNTKDFLADEKKNAYRDIGPMEGWEQYRAKNDPYGMTDFDAGALQKMKDSYDQYQSGYNKKVTDRDTQLAQYQRSSAPSKGIGFFEYMANPGNYNVSNPAPAQAAPAPSPTNSGSNWSPTR